VLEPPTRVADVDVLRTVRASWDPAVDAVEHLPVGFGAHHWRADAEGGPRWFVTLDGPLDGPGSRHTHASLEAAYAAAAALAGAGLDFVHACRPASTGATAVPLAGGALSLTPWLAGDRVGDGPPPTRRSAEQTARMLRRLHAATAPPQARRWSAFIDPGLADDLADRTTRPWSDGPFGERACRAVQDGLARIARWSGTYQRRAAEALDRPWVTTHGEPHTRNQVHTPHGPVLVDWESLCLAPAERDLRTLTGAGHGDLVEADPAMLELFDLEWRLDEISQYADWFEAPHDEGPDARTAWGGLVHELERD